MMEIVARRAPGIPFAAMETTSRTLSETPASQRDEPLRETNSGSRSRGPALRQPQRLAGFERRSGGEQLHGDGRFPSPPVQQAFFNTGCIELNVQLSLAAHEGPTARGSLCILQPQAAGRESA